jgi:phage N-6-adenine-methyltransferase
MINNALYSSATDDWATPQAFFDEWNSYFDFDLDACADDHNAKCANYYTKEDDALKQPWSGRVWMNPPYGREIEQWMHKAYNCGAEVVVCLVPARTDTKWWHNYAKKGDVFFLKGRLKFGKATTSAPFPSAIVVFSKFNVNKWLHPLSDKWHYARNFEFES